MGFFGGLMGQNYRPIQDAAAGGASTAQQTAMPAERGLQTVGIPGLTSMIAKGGQLSPYMKATVSRERRGTLQDAEAAKQAALKGAAYRGLGAPSGAASSAENVITRGKQLADTEALNRAFERQAGLNLQATSGLAGIGTGFGGLQSDFLGKQLQATQLRDAAMRSGLGSIMGLGSAALGAFA